MMSRHIVKITGFIILGFYLSSSGVSGQTLFKINQYDVLYNGNLMPIITLYTNYQINEHIGITNYFYVTAYPQNSWGEGLVGVSYTIVKGITIGFLAGYQSNETELWRISPIIGLYKKPFSFFGAFEFGGKRYRWDAMGFYELHSWKFGGEFIRYYQMYAAGPRVEFSFLKNNILTVFHSSLWDWVYGKYAAMFGIYASFGNMKPASGKIKSKD
ncbi:MAG: hypothetical protein NTU51_00990 [Bacteroidetes bacterium]|nr:hypothetical protein [Bacteroidota bacterium]